MKKLSKMGSAKDLPPLISRSGCERKVRSRTARSVCRPAAIRQCVGMFASPFAPRVPLPSPFPWFPLSSVARWSSRLQRTSPETNSWAIKLSTGEHFVDSAQPLLPLLPPVRFRDPKTGNSWFPLFRPISTQSDPIRVIPTNSDRKKIIFLLAPSVRNGDSLSPRFGYRTARWLLPETLDRRHFVSHFRRVPAQLSLFAPVRDPKTGNFRTKTPPGQFPDIQHQQLATTISGPWSGFGFHVPTPFVPFVPSVSFNLCNDSTIQRLNLNPSPLCMIKIN